MILSAQSSSQRSNKRICSAFISACFLRSSLFFWVPSFLCRRQAGVLLYVAKACCQRNASGGIEMSFLPFSGVYRNLCLYLSMILICAFLYYMVFFAGYIWQNNSKESGFCVCHNEHSARCHGCHGEIGWNCTLQHPPISIICLASSCALFQTLFVCCSIELFIEW